MLRTIAALLMLVPSLVPSIAMADGIAAGQQYSDARETIIADGWQPVKSGECAPLYVCSEYPEAEKCSTSGVMYCLFNWSRGADRMQIVTEGEENFTVVEVRP